MVETLAYQYTRKPPKFARPRPNVIVRLCTIECSFSQPLETGDQNRTFREDIEGWCRITPRLYIWDYSKNNHCLLTPYPNIHVLGPNVRYFARNHAVGVFEQGDRHTGTGDFVRLRAWLLAHLLWNPDAKQQQLVNDFLNGYYGKAGPYLSQYVDLMSAAVCRSGVYLGYYSKETLKNTSTWLTLEDMNRATRLFDNALAAVSGEPILLERVRRERLPLDLVWLERYDELKRLAAREGCAFFGPKDPVAACEAFIQLSTRHRAGLYGSGRPFELFAAELRSQISALSRQETKASDR
jgi:hypothetical protein